jgi:hypothetical protein
MCGAVPPAAVLGWALIEAHLTPCGALAASMLEVISGSVLSCMTGQLDLEQALAVWARGPLHQQQRCRGGTDGTGDERALLLVRS